MNIYLAIILTIIIVRWLLGLIVEKLNLRYTSDSLPEDFQGYYDDRRYKKSQDYLRATTHFSLIKQTFTAAVLVTFILGAGFNFVDKIARGFNQGPILTGLLFAGMLLLAGQLIDIPFSAYRTFVIEERFGFNRTSPKTFVLDLLKSLILTAVIGALIFSSLLWLFAKAGRLAWIYCWAVVTLFQLFLSCIAPAVILPLFNKFVPLEKGYLRASIESYTRAQNFKLRGIYKIDASRRSTKSNAYFTGLGRYKRIALFDTLIARHSSDELVSVLAHEIGHYKQRHIIKGLAVSTIEAAIMFFMLSLFINHRGLFAAFKMEEVSIYASLFFFVFLYAPISLAFSLLSNSLSRRHEYAADRYAVSTYRKPQEFITALKKLSADNLTNLTPHPLKVFLDYSHPPVLDRIQAIQKMAHLA